MERHEGSSRGKAKAGLMTDFDCTKKSNRFFARESSPISVRPQGGSGQTNKSRLPVDRQARRAAAEGVALRAAALSRREQGIIKAVWFATPLGRVGRPSATTRPTA